jgi:hypothetical protein
MFARAIMLLINKGRSVEINKSHDVPAINQAIEEIKNFRTGDSKTMKLEKFKNVIALGALDKSPYALVASELAESLDSLVILDKEITPHTPFFEISEKRTLTKVNDFLIIQELCMLLDIKPAKAAEILSMVKVRKSKNRIDEPVPVAFADDPGLAWHRLSLTREQAGSLTLNDIPEFAQFCDRINEDDGAHCLILWLGSLVDPRSNKAQYIHLQGPGGDGKSVLTTALQTVLKDRCVRFKAKNMLDNHFGAELEGARLAIIADENNADFVSGGVFKEITGEDFLRVNEKFKSPRVIKLSCKILITSNSEAEIRSSAADIRRLISISLSSPAGQEVESDPEWGARFVASAEKILGFCASIYEEEATKNPYLVKQLPAPKSSTQKAIRKAIEEQLNVIEELFQVTGSPQDFISRAEIVQAVAEAGFRSIVTGPRALEQFYSAIEYVSNPDGLSPIPVKRSGTRGFRGVKIK